MVTHLPADTGRKVFNYDPVFSTNRRSIPARRVQRGKKVSSVRNLEHKKFNVFCSLLQDLSQVLSLFLDCRFDSP